MYFVIDDADLSFSLNDFVYYADDEVYARDVNPVGFPGFSIHQNLVQDTDGGDWSWGVTVECDSGGRNNLADIWSRGSFDSPEEALEDLHAATLNDFDGLYFSSLNGAF